MQTPRLEQGKSPTLHTLDLGTGLLLYFSYATIIGFAEHGQAHFTENRWSNTTGKHLAELGSLKQARLPREAFEAKLSETLGRHLQPAPAGFPSRMQAAVIGIEWDPHKSAPYETLQDRQGFSIPGSEPDERAAKELLDTGWVLEVEDPMGARPLKMVYVDTDKQPDLHQAQRIIEEIYVKHGFVLR
jgi:hypothetical protein